MFDQKEFDQVSQQVGSVFRWTKVFAILAVALNFAVAIGLIYLLYAGAQWLLGNS
jgi:hypothetical protein